MKRIALVVVVAACGSSSSAPDARTADTPDARVHDAAVPDAEPPPDSQPPACDLSQPFELVGGLESIATAQDELYVVPETPDLLTVFFASNRPDFANTKVYVAIRAFADDPFGTAELVDELDLTGQDNLTFLTADGKTAFLHRPEAGLGMDLYWSQRSGPGATFGTPTAVPDVNGVGDDVQAWLAPSGTLYFASDRTGGEAKLYRAAPTTPGHFATPEVITELDGTGAESKPVLTDDERTIYFTRGGLIHEATRDSSTGSFGNERVAGELGGEGLNLTSWVSGDGCRLIFTSDGVTGPAGLEPFLAAKPPA